MISFPFSLNLSSMATVILRAPFCLSWASPALPSLSVQLNFPSVTTYWDVFRYKFAITHCSLMKQDTTAIFFKKNDYHFQYSHFNQKYTIWQQWLLCMTYNLCLDILLHNFKPTIDSTLLSWLPFLLWVNQSLFIKAPLIQCDCLSTSGNPQGLIYMLWFKY